MSNGQTNQPSRAAAEAACDRAEKAARDLGSLIAEMQVGDVLAGKIISEVLGSDPTDRGSIHNRVASMPVPCPGCPTLVRLQAERDELVETVSGLQSDLDQVARERVALEERNAALERYPTVSSTAGRPAVPVAGSGPDFTNISGT